MALVFPIKTKKSFGVKIALDEIICLFKLQNNHLIYSVKIDLPTELELKASKVSFQELVFKLFKRSVQAYQDFHSLNKIILFTAQLDAAQYKRTQEIVLSITNGGQKLSFLEKFLPSTKLLLRDSATDSGLQQIKFLLRKQFAGKLDIIDKNQTGFTLCCHLPIKTTKR